MSNFLQIHAFIERAEILEPFSLSISAPELSKSGGDYFCMVHAPTLLKRDTEIFGIDGEQAQELALKFAKSLLGHVRLVDRDRQPISW